MEAAVARVRRVFAGVCGSPGSVQALRYAAGIARTQGGELIPVLAWTPPGGDLADRGGPSAYLRQVWKEAAWQRLHYTMELAFGSMPDDLPVEPLVVRGDPGAVLVNVANDEDDMIVVGAGRRGMFARMSACRVSRYCVAHAKCPVVTVPPSALAEMGRGLRGWAFRHRSLRLEQVSLPQGGSFPAS
jgi:nucleotide-binding universal stress UspA family protein